MSCAAPAWPQVPTRPERNRRWERVHARTLAEDWWPCPQCGARRGWECPGDTPHPTRIDLARRKWWGPMYEEQMRRRGLAVGTASCEQRPS
jgi:hypothetical protein